MTVYDNTVISALSGVHKIISLEKLLSQILRRPNCQRFLHLFQKTQKDSIKNQQKIIRPILQRATQIEHTHAQRTDNLTHPKSKEKNNYHCQIRNTQSLHSVGFPYL